jgi:hypothetical protein
MKKTYMVLLTALVLVLAMAIPAAWTAYRSGRVTLVGGPYATGLLYDSGATGVPVFVDKTYVDSIFPEGGGIAVGSTLGVWIGDTLGDLTFEGATKDTSETRITVVDPTADAAWILPGNTAGPMYFMSTTLATNAPSMANSVTGGSNFLAFEGTVDAHEIKLSAADATADVIYSLIDAAAGTYYPMISTLATNAYGKANAIWGVSNGLAFGGATLGTTNFTTLTVADPTAARVITMPDATGGVPLVLKKDITIAQIASTDAVEGSTLAYTLPDTGGFIHVMCGGTINTDDQGAKTLALLGGATVVTTLTIAQADDGEYLYEAYVGVLAAATVVAGSEVLPAVDASTVNVDTNVAGTALDVSAVTTWTVQMDLAHADDEMSIHWCIWELKP